MAATAAVDRVFSMALHQLEMTRDTRSCRDKFHGGWGDKYRSKI